MIAFSLSPPTRWLCAFAVVLSVLLLAWPQAAMAALPDNNVLDGIIDAYQAKVAAWEPVLTGYALRLFWLLVGLDLVWTGIALAMRGADLQEFTGELVRRIFFIGLFLALLLHSSDWAQAIVDSLRRAADAANAAAGGTAGISPSSVFDIGLKLASQITEKLSAFSPFASLGLLISGLIVMICFALIAAFMLLALVQMYIVISAGVILLGLGGSGWTSPYALKYWSAALSVGLKLFVLQLLIGIGQSFINDWLSNFDSTSNSQILILVGASVVMLALVKIIPDMLQDLIHGASFGPGTPMVGAVRSVGGAAAGAGVAAAGGLLAIREAASLAHAQGASGLLGHAGGAARRLASAAGQDIAGRLAGLPGHHHGTLGGRLAASLRAQRLALAPTPAGGNIIGPGRAPTGGSAEPAGTAAGDPSRSRYLSPLNNGGRDPP